MKRFVRVDGELGPVTYYLEYHGACLRVWALNHASKAVKVVAKYGEFDDDILDGYIGLFSLAAPSSLVVFIKTYSGVQYAWLNIQDGIDQMLAFATLKMDNFKPTSNLSISTAPTKHRFVVLQSDDVILIGDEIKTSLLAVSTTPISWVTDLGVFKNYIQPDNDLMVDMIETPFSEDIVVITTKDRVTRHLNISLCEIDWVKNKLKVLWRLPTYAEHVLVACMGSAATDAKVLLCILNTLCVYDIDGQQVCTGSVSSAITSASGMRASECVVSTVTGSVHACQLDASKGSMSIEDVSMHLVQLTDYMPQPNALSSQSVFTRMDVLRSDSQHGARSLVLVGSNALTSTLCISPHIINEYASMRTFGFRINLARTSVHTNRQLGVCRSGHPSTSLVFESAPMANVAYAETLSVDLEAVYDAHALAPVCVNNDVYVVLTSRVTQQTSILNVSSKDSQACVSNALTSMLCTVEYTHYLYMLAGCIIQVTSSMLFVYNTATHTLWKVAWNELVASARSTTSHKIHNVTILFAIPCHNALYLYCTKTLVKVWFHASSGALGKGVKQGIQEVIVEEMACRCAYVTASTYLYPIGVKAATDTLTGQFDYVIAHSYWEDSAIRLEYHRHNPTNTQFHDKICLDIPLPSTPQHHEIVKDMKVVLLNDLMYLVYHYKHQLYLCEVEFDLSSRQLRCVLLWSHVLTPTVHITHMSVSIGGELGNAVGVIVLLNNDNVLEIRTDTNETPRLSSYYLPYTRIQSVYKVGTEITCNFQEEMGHGIGRCLVSGDGDMVQQHVSKMKVCEGDKVLMGRFDRSIAVYREKESGYYLTIYNALTLDVTAELTLSSSVHALPSHMDFHAPYGNMFYTISLDQEKSCIDIRAFQFDAHRGSVSLGGKASCAVYLHANLADSPYHHTSVTMDGKEYLALLTNTSDLCLFGWDFTNQFTMLSHMEVSVCSPSLKMMKLPWDSTTSLMLVHSVVSYNDFVVANLATGKMILFQCTQLTNGKFAWKILLELAMERPVLSMHCFPTSLNKSARTLYDTMTFLAYSPPNENFYLYHVSVPTANADEDTLAASVINPTYVLRRFVLDAALRRMMSGGIANTAAVTESDLTRCVHAQLPEVPLESVQRLEHLGSDEDSVRVVGGIWWQVSLNNSVDIILKPMLERR